MAEQEQKSSTASDSKTEEWNELTPIPFDDPEKPRGTGQPRNPEFIRQQHDNSVRTILVVSIVSLLVVMALLPLGLAAVKSISEEAMFRFYGGPFPLIVTLVSSVAGYYFALESRNKN